MLTFTQRSIVLRTYGYDEDKLTMHSYAVTCSSSSGREQLEPVATEAREAT
jgi:hypothetical protein